MAHPSFRYDNGGPPKLPFRSMATGAIHRRHSAPSSPRRGPNLQLEMAVTPEGYAASLVGFGILRTNSRRMIFRLKLKRRKLLVDEIVHRLRPADETNTPPRAERVSVMRIRGDETPFASRLFFDQDVDQTEPVAAAASFSKSSGR
jgi:hypothetical protein